MKDANQAIARENYLKTIVKHVAETGQPLVAGSELVRQLGVSSGTISTMILRLEAAGLLKVEPHKGCTLTPEGQRFGLEVLRRHRLLELFLNRTLGLDWTEVHEEAEHLEHALSEKLTDRIDAFLGYPDRDPHGDPIPRKGQKDLPAAGVALGSLEPGTEALVVRVAADTTTLQYAEQIGLIPGTRVRVVSRPPGSGLIHLVWGNRSEPLATTVLEQVFVAQETES